MQDKQTLHSVKGIRLSTAAAHIKYPNRMDVALIELGPNAQTAAVFTQNAFCAAPVDIAKRHLRQTQPQYLLINAGNANAGTGEEGRKRCLATIQRVAELSGCQPTEVLPFSTGVIGEDLPDDKIHNVIPTLLSKLNGNHWLSAAEAIMTTDTVAKTTSTQFNWQGETITITGMCKGSGMICPNMATMLAFIATDATIAQPLLQTLLKTSTEKSFNATTVDSDTSTNDACVLIATQQTKLVIAETEPVLVEQFQQHLQHVMQTLARAIVRDAEGATKFITIAIHQGQTIDECKTIAYAIAHSPLVKTAFFASDPNWGRILAAIGKTSIANFDINRVEIWLGDEKIVASGARAPSYNEAAVKKVMSKSDITLTVNLGRGQQQTTLWTSDLSYDYIKINAEYRT